MEDKISEEWINKITISRNGDAWKWEIERPEGGNVSGLTQSASSGLESVIDYITNRRISETVFVELVIPEKADTSEIERMIALYSAKKVLEIARPGDVIKLKAEITSRSFTCSKCRQQMHEMERDKTTPGLCKTCANADTVDK